MLGSHEDALQPYKIRGQRKALLEVLKAVFGKPLTIINFFSVGLQPGGQ